MAHDFREGFSRLKSYYEPLLKTSLDEGICHEAVKQNFQNGQDSGGRHSLSAKAQAHPWKTGVGARSIWVTLSGKAGTLPIPKSCQEVLNDLLRWLSGVDKADSRGIKNSWPVGSSLASILCPSRYFPREVIIERACPAVRPKDEEGRLICCQFILG